MHTMPHEVLISLNKPIFVHDGRKITKTHGAIVRSDFLHKTRCDGNVISICLESESYFGQEIEKLFYFENILSFDNPLVQKLSRYFNEYLSSYYSESDMKAFLITTLSGKQRIELLNNKVRSDERMENVVNHLKLYCLNNAIDFSELQKIASLSESRLIHLFKKEIGITIRKYILWCRIKEALKLMAGGHNINQAAKKSGSSDSAHFNRTFVSMFGINPSQLLK